MRIFPFRSRSLAVHLLIACLVHFVLAAEHTLQLDGATKDIGSLKAGQKLQITWSQATKPVEVTLIDSGGTTVTTIASGLSGTARRPNLPVIGDY